MWIVNKGNKNVNLHKESIFLPHGWQKFERCTCVSYINKPSIYLQLTTCLTRNSKKVLQNKQLLGRGMF